MAPSRAIRRIVQNYCFIDLRPASIVSPATPLGEPDKLARRSPLEPTRPEEKLEETIDNLGQLRADHQLRRSIGPAGDATAV